MDTVNFLCGDTPSDTTANIENLLVISNIEIAYQNVVIKCKDVIPRVTKYANANLRSEQISLAGQFV